jgi:hypothetical protein
MPQTDVTALLGQPDETSAGTYGTATAKPWNGIVWAYQFGHSSLDRCLYIVFEPVKNDYGTLVWIVNSWQWGGVEQ